jgi:Domain of unknown function (DUF4340)
MKSKGLIVAVVLLAGLTGVLYWSNHHQPSANAGITPPDSGPVLFNLKQDDIVKFDLKKNGEEEAALAREGSSDNWQVTAPTVVPAAPDAISGLMTSLAKLTSNRLVEDKPVALEQYGLGLAQPKQEVDITTKDGVTRSLLIGDDAPAGQSTYAMLKGDPRVFTIPGYVKDVLDRHPRDLRDKRLITLDADKITHVELDAKQPIEFVRENGSWQMAKPKLLRADASAIDSYVDNLAQAEMDVSAINQTNKQAEDGFAGGTLLATVKATGDSGTQTVEIRKNNGDYYAKVSVGGGIYKISPTTSEGIVKTAEDFRDKKLFDFGNDDPDKVEMQDGAKSYVLSKFGDDWHLGGDKGAKVDTTAAQEFVGKLRSLVATKFPDSGFVSPSITVTVTSGGGKHVEKVSISKNGTRAIGKREGDPTLYELDSTLVGEMEKSAAAMKPIASK